MRKESSLYARLVEGVVECGICQRRCVVPESGRGWCRTRVNDGGRLYSEIYGEVPSVSVNPIEKKPVFHFHPGSRWLSLGSVGCNFRCPGCQNWDIAHWTIGLSGTTYMAPEEAVSKAKKAEALGISGTFNEPARGVLRGMAAWIRDALGPGPPWHVTSFHPHLELGHLPPTPVSLLEKARVMGKEEGLWYVYLGNVPGHPGENTWCHACGELLIERDLFVIRTCRIRRSRCPKCGTAIPGEF